MASSSILIESPSRSVAQQGGAAELPELCLLGLLAFNEQHVEAEGDQQRDRGVFGGRADRRAERGAQPEPHQGYASLKEGEQQGDA